MDSEINKAIQDHLELISEISEDSSMRSNVKNAIDMLVDCFRSGKKVLICGNGGSAADAEHIAAELCGKFDLDRKALFAEALHVNSASLTAISNDYGYDKVFARILEAKAEANDVLIAYSTSGSSPNILEALKFAKDIKMSIICFHGGKAKSMSAFADIDFEIPSASTARIQEAYMLLSHIICQQVEKKLFA